MTRTLLLLTVVCLAAGAASAQTRTTEREARSYIHSAFISGAAHAILASDVALAPQLRERLRLPPDASRDRIYEALFTLTEDKTLRVRKSNADEAAAVAPSAKASPVFALEGGILPLAVVYDLDRNAIPYVAILGAQAAAGGTLPARDEPKAVRVADTRPAAMPMRASEPPPAPTVIRLKPIAFAFQDATLGVEAKAELELQGLPKIAEIREVRYVVHGHADRLGSASYNQRLSEKRAAAVRDYLVTKGVPAGNIETIGFGSTMSQTTCHQLERRALIECLAPDRRVTVEIQPPPM